MRCWLNAVIVSVIAGTMLAAEKTIDLSVVIPKSEAEAILGEPVKDPMPLNATGKDGLHSKCMYFSTKSTRSLSLRLHEAAKGSLSAIEEFNQVAANLGPLTPVADLGDRAGFFIGNVHNGMPADALMLYVVKGNAFITIGLGGLTADDEPLEKARTVAKEILTNL